MQLWGQSGDSISEAYVGTKATTTKLAREGGGAIAGMLEQGIKGFER